MPRGNRSNCAGRICPMVRVTALKSKTAEASRWCRQPSNPGSRCIPSPRDPRRHRTGNSWSAGACRRSISAARKLANRRGALKIE